MTAMTISASGYCFLSPLIHIQKKCEEGDSAVNRLIGRMTAIVIPVFEFLQGIQFTVHAIGILVTRLFAIPVIIFEIIAKEDQSVLEKTVPGVTDLIKTILRAVSCFAMIISAPILTLISPDLNAAIHEIFGLCLIGKPLEDREGEREVNFKKKNLESISIELKQEGAGLKGIVGMKKYKEELRRTVIDPLVAVLNADPSYQAFARQFGPLEAERGIIFYGPTGCGKSEIARSIAQELKYPYVEISPRTLGSQYVDGSIEILRKLLKQIEEYVPAVLIINECETLFTNRLQLDESSTSGKQTSKLVGALLDAFDQLKEKGLIVIGTTNLDLSKQQELEKLDPALLRHGRLGKHLQIPMPDEETRADLIKHYTPWKFCSASLVDLVKEFKGRTVAEIQAFGTHLKDHIWKRVRGESVAVVEETRWGLEDVKRLLKEPPASDLSYYL